MTDNDPTDEQNPPVEAIGRLMDSIIDAGYGRTRLYVRDADDLRGLTLRGHHSLLRDTFSSLRISGQDPFSQHTEPQILRASDFPERDSDLKVLEKREETARRCIWDSGVRAA